MILSAQVKTHIETILKSPLHHPVSDITHFPGPGHSTLQYWHCIIQTDHKQSSHHLHFSKFSYFFSESPSFSHLVLVWITFFLDLCPANCLPRPSSQSESSPCISYQHSASVVFCIFLCKILHDEYVAEPRLILSVKLYAHSTTTSFFHILHHRGSTTLLSSPTFSSQTLFITHTSKFISQVTTTDTSYWDHSWLR